MRSSFLLFQRNPARDFAWTGSLAAASRALALGAALALTACAATEGTLDGEPSRAAAKPNRSAPADALAQSHRDAEKPRITASTPPTAGAVGGAVSPGVLRPLMPAAESSGVIDVRLHPIEGVAPGTSQLVTFGVPFTRGSITQAGLSKLRILNADGEELAAYVEQITPWRHVTTPALDGTSVRVARVQIRYTFKLAYPNFETIRVEWGYRDRTRTVANLENPRNGWQAVTSGSFVAGDGVSEPKVYAVFPPETMSKGVLKIGPMRPFAKHIGPGRDDPATMDATEHYPAYEEQMYATKNFFYAHINEDDPRVTGSYLIPYKGGEGEPWLYDRVSTFYFLYFRSGFFKALRESVRAAEFYRINLYPEGTVPDIAVGTFRLKNPDPNAYIGPTGAMYSYPEAMAYTYWVTGDDLSRDAARIAAKALEDAGEGPIRWSPTSSYTERRIGFRLMAHTIGFELFGNVPYKNGSPLTYRERILTIVENLIWHQNGAGGQLPANRVDGGLWKYGFQEGNGPENQLLVSFWQTPVVIEPMVRNYVLTDNVDIAHFIRRTGNALKFAGKSYTPAQRWYRTDLNENLRLVDYVTLIDGATYEADGAGPEHALGLAGAMAWSYYFSLVTNQRDETLKQAANELYRSYGYEVNEWTRPTAPASGASAYRNSPPRRYNWTYKPSGSLSWCLSELRWVKD